MMTQQHFAWGVKTKVVSLPWLIPFLATEVVDLLISVMLG